MCLCFVFPMKLQTVKKALDHCDGSVKEARDLYTTLNDCAQKLDETVKGKVTNNNQYFSYFRIHTLKYKKDLKLLN